MALIEFPGVESEDIARNLRALADEIERGERKPFNLAWVADEGTGKPTMGIYGLAHPRYKGVLAHFLFACGQRTIEG